MAQSGQRKCLCCGQFFDSDHRNRKRQLYCSAADCRRASKAASQSNWLSDADNFGYFNDPAHVARVKAWRAAHPGYGRNRPRKASALQDPLIVQVHESKEESAKRIGSSLQDLLDHLLDPPSPVLAGLIAHLFAVTLQEDWAATTRLLVQLGRDVLNRSGYADDDAGHEDRKALQALHAARLGVHHPKA